MNQNYWQSYNQKSMLKNKAGIFSWYGFVMPFEKRIELIRQAGFGATSLWWEDEDMPYPTKREDMPRLVREAGLFLENIHVPFNDSDALWSENNKDRETVVKRHLEWLQDCAQHQIPMMVMHLSDRPDSEASMRQGLKSLEVLTRAAEALGVVIAVENTRHNDRVRFILESLPSESLGFCFDSSHHLLTDRGCFKLLEDFGSRLAATHISDNDGLEDRHWLPGHGVIDWQGVSRAFPLGYSGCLTLEVSPTQEERQGTPQAFLERAYQRVAAVGGLIAETRGPEIK
ncbi:sugar phosphate isomerase/epimerase family protein [Acidaminobacter hydrogenoformans]|uniref:Sugar phosphate isomerase/epimerase n=1 Tax=Acidaminobacter hydrogenoformans DSM 2784 TaxID=1120920 RepID=A0A1G5S7Y7_9FIRM|nr:sugar phosphate isomerase/epimerase family protein [Acidaminobacter hydrogenoformans]SCZ81831.1 Sugar phosphate isomerase/epimerase [Acidaminobacter hydrogenoformans DSM 2784]